MTAPRELALFGVIHVDSTEKVTRELRTVLDDVDVVFIEYPHDPPVLTPETLQPTLEDPLVPEDGRLSVPDGPGLGVDVDEELDANGEVVWSTELSG
jgi:L-alanine-DL-glutamate epimerase-like enolase superfamily enzyme